VEYYRVWLISKVNRISPFGICNATMTQDKINEHSDYIEKDETGKVIGKWADFRRSAVEPVDNTPDSSLIITTTSKITASGTTN